MWPSPDDLWPLLRSALGSSVLFFGRTLAVFLWACLRGGPTRVLPQVVTTDQVPSSGLSAQTMVELLTELRALSPKGEES